MTPRQAQFKLQRLLLLQQVRNNFTKLVPTLRYATTEEQARKEIMSVLQLEELTDKDFNFILSLSVKDLALFTSEEKLLQEIEKCKSVLSKSLQKKIPALF